MLYLGMVLAVFNIFRVIYMNKQLYITYDSSYKRAFLFCESCFGWSLYIYGCECWRRLVASLWIGITCITMSIWYCAVNVDII